MSELNLQEDPHRRLNILTGEWILVSPHRMKRPWQGIVEETSKEVKPKYDPDCYLCPGNSRAGGIKNPGYQGIFVFDNDFSSLKPDSPSLEFNTKNLIAAKGEKGICRVVCFSPRHDLTLADLSTEEIKNIIDVWIREYKELGEKDFINYVQIFENKGELMGCSNPHPHGQIWAQQSIPVEPAKETKAQKEYLKKNIKHDRFAKSCLLCDYLKLELKQKERLVYQNENFIALVPFWATWPFEILIIGKKHRKNITELSDNEKASFAEIIKVITGTYDKVFGVSFPYSAGIHQSPTDGKEHDEWHFHFHFYPPLLRSANIKKFMVGYEMLAEPQRDFTPENSAKILKDLL